MNWWGKYQAHDLNPYSIFDMVPFSCVSFPTPNAVLFFYLHFPYMSSSQAAALAFSFRSSIITSTASISVASTLLVEAWPLFDSSSRQISMAG